MDDYRRIVLLITGAIRATSKSAGAEDEMQIKFQAFNLKCTSSLLPCDDFFETLTGITSAPYIYQRNIYTIKLPHHNDLYGGLVLTIKDMKKFCKLVKNDKVIKVIEHKLKDNESMTEFNFFVFDLANKYGMYQYYHNSCSLRTFLNSILHKIYMETLRQMKKEKETELEKAGNKEWVIRRKLAEYNGTLKETIIERKDAFEERIRKMRKLDSIEFETMEHIERIFSGFPRISDAIKKQKYTFSIKPELRGSHRLMDAVARFFTDNTPAQASVRGEDNNGHDKVYRLLNDFDSFAEYDYDDLVQSLMLDSSDVEKSISNNDIIKKLMRVYDENKELF